MSTQEKKSAVKTEVGPEGPLTRPHEQISRLAKLIKLTGLTKSQAAACAGLNRRTLNKWFSTQRCPSASAVEAAILAIETHALTIMRMEDTHHLYLDPTRGWQVRFTIELDSRVIGKRIKRNLGTRDMTEAIQRRNLLIAEYERMGFQVSNRRQGRQSKRREPRN